MPVPASRISSDPSKSSTDTHEVCPPNRTVSGPGDASEPPAVTLPMLITGRERFEVWCAPCHGMSGKGDGPVAKYYPPAGDLTRGDVQRHSDGWFYLVIVNGTEKMPSYAHELERTERWQVVRFMRTLANPVP